MVLKLYGSRWSPNAKRVAMVLLEKNVPFQAIEVNMIDQEHKTRAYVEKQPFGQVPYIVSFFASQDTLFTLMLQLRTMMA